MAFTNYAVYSANMTPQQKAIYIDSLAQGNTNVQYGSDPSTLPPTNAQGGWSGIQQQINNSTPSSGSGSGGSGSGGGSGDTGPTDEELINEYYNSANKLLNTQKQGLMDNQQNYYDIATNPYTSQAPLVQSAGDAGLANNANQQTTAGTQTQNALAAARQLFNELSSRNMQAFGSGALGSVGQAAGEIMGRSAQQQFGNIRTSGDQTLQQLQTAATELQQKTTDQLNQLELQKNTALAQAKLDFQDKLDYIDQQKSLIGQAKAAAKLSAMQDYRNTISNMQNQAVLLRGQIAAQAAANQQNVLAQTGAFDTATGGIANQGVANLTNQGLQANAAMSNFQGQNALSGDNNQGNVTSQLYGGLYSSPQTTNKYDQYGNPIYA